MGAAEEVALYEGAGVPVNKFGLDFGNNWCSPQPTFGQEAVGVSFNPSNMPEVDKCKQLFADAIDQMNDLRNASESGGQKRHASAAITDIETAQMRAVKALTWRGK